VWRGSVGGGDEERISVVNLQMAFDMRYGESSNSHQLQNSLRRSLCNHRFRAHGMRNAQTRIQSIPEKERKIGASMKMIKHAHTVLAPELVDGVDEAVVQIGRPSEARHLGPVVLPDAAAPLPADHRPHHGHLSISQLASSLAPTNNTKPTSEE
jgi:hypothetical protein